MKNINIYTNGYYLNNEHYCCAFCSTTFEDGIIYLQEEQMMTAEKAVKKHLADNHQPVMELLAFNKNLTGLTEIQTEVLQHTASGLTDSEIAKKMNVSPSTIRNHKFKLREKAKQAEVFLAIMHLLNEKNEFVPVHKEATMMDDRYAITLEEKEKILKTYIDEHGKCSVFPSKEKRKIIILNYVIEKFNRGQQYTEVEVNQILKQIFEDHVTVRRYLIEYGYMDRSKDCTSYWRK